MVAPGVGIEGETRWNEQFPGNTQRAAFEHPFHGHIGVQQIPRGARPFRQRLLWT
jgi:hypothetical protein